MLTNPIKLNSFLQAAEKYPESASLLLKATQWDISEGTVIDTILDELSDDPDYHGVGYDNFTEFLALITK